MRAMTKAAIRKQITGFLKLLDGADDALELTVALRAMEKECKKMEGTLIPSANTIFADAYNGMKCDVLNAVVSPYTKPTQYEYSEEVAVMELDLKQQKERERLDGTATPIGQGSSRTDVTFSIKFA